MDDLIQQGINSFKAGNYQIAREKLTEALHINPDNERAWGYLYNVCENDVDRVHCLRQMLRLNPKNFKARATLDKLESIIPAEVFSEATPLIITEDAPASIFKTITNSKEAADSDSDVDPLQATEILREMFQKEAAQAPITARPEEKPSGPFAFLGTSYTPMIISIMVLIVVILAFILWLISIGRSGQGPLSGLATATLTPTNTATFTPTYTSTATATPTLTATPTATITRTPANTLTPSQTYTTGPSLTPTLTVSPTLLPTKTITPSLTPRETLWPSRTPGPTNTHVPTLALLKTKTPAHLIPTITPTVAAVTFDELCKNMSGLTSLQQTAWMDDHPFMRVGPWRGKAVNYMQGNAIYISVSGGRYPMGSDMIFISPKGPYVMNQTYDFYGQLITFEASNNFCHGVIQSDDRESMNKVVKP